ncbi:ATP-binding protein [bacterium]
MYSLIILEHIEKYSQMVFIAGPRQVGKTTLSKMIHKNHDKTIYFNWDDRDDRKLILKGQSSLAKFAGVEKISKERKIIIFDEIHKYRKWKSFLKGFYDVYKNDFKIIVTGSAKLNIYKSGGDSLMGRYLLYRLHPFTVRETISSRRDINEIVLPKKIKSEEFQDLLKFGGFPEPFLKKDTRFYNRWKELRFEQLFQEDIRDLTNVQDISRMEILAQILTEHSAQLLSYSSLANKIDVTSKTVKKWIDILGLMYFCFKIKPYRKNVVRSLIKEPKIYLWDWSYIKDTGARLENFIASHLLKAVHYWTDIGLGKYELFFIRDKEKREVDFLVTKDMEPWFLVEVKASSKSSLSSSLIRFKKELKVPHAFQVVFDMDYINKDCFSEAKPVIVPVQTLLSQLV